MKSIAYLRYVLDEMQAPRAVKLKYLGEKVLKAPVVRLNRLCGLHLPLPYLLREDYTLSNRYGTWRIRHGSDFDYSINPLFEQSLEPSFQCRGKVFLDIGAHIGKWSVFVARASPAVQVYAFEPHPLSFDYLQQNVRLNRLPNVEPVHAAVSSARSRALFEMPRVNTEMSKLVSSPGREGCDVMQVDTVSVDGFLGERGLLATDVGLVKVDVEGHELQVLEGMRGLLGGAADLTLICEILRGQTQREEIFRFMAELGYAATQLPTGVDFLFRRRRAAECSPAAAASA
jgi:FkbM family methyltransferase